MTDDRDGTSPLGDHSPDRLAIQRQVDLMHMRDRFWKAARRRDPELLRALQVDDDMAVVAIWMENTRASPFYRRRALRILVRRFGKLGTRTLIRAASDVSDHTYRLILRERQPDELPDPGLPDRLQERLKEADLLKAVKGVNARARHPAARKASRAIFAFAKALPSLASFAVRVAGEAVSPLISFSAP